MKNRSSASKLTEERKYILIRLIPCIVAYLVFSAPFTLPMLDDLWPSILIQICLLFLFISFSWVYFKYNYDDKKSKELVQTYLSRDKYVEVVPILPHSSDYAYSFTKGLVNIATFHAILDAEGNVVVNVIFNKDVDGESHIFQTVSPKQFRGYYRLKEETK